MDIGINNWLWFPGLEVVSAVLSVMLIYILTAFLLFEAVQRTVHQDFSIDGDVMLITAAVGVAVNLMWVELKYVHFLFKRKLWGVNIYSVNLCYVSIFMVLIVTYWLKHFLPY